ncbi:MAG: sterol desaturase family protein [Candidatus Melainabacteria bacterium]|nr:sterol desaturase family protein [Candidatus Melainabacteria bacterium]
MIIVHFIGWVVLSCVIMSFVEHQVHRQLMHRRNYLSDRHPSFKKTFEMHAIFHHGQYSKIFSDEPVAKGEDQEIQLRVHKAAIKALPVIVIIAMFSIPCAIVFAGVVTLHHWIWNKIHLEMHKPEHPGFSRWPIYKFLARYHWLHHRYPDKNFNVVFPFADYVLGSCARPTAKDLQLMKEQLEPQLADEPAAQARCQPAPRPKAGVR